MPDPTALSVAALLETFIDLDDPRRDHLKAYALPDIMVLVVPGLLRACENWVEIADFGHAHAAWFQEQGLFPN